MRAGKKRFIVGMAGGSGSGKTTFARRVLEESEKSGIRGQIFSLDHYYHSLSHLSLAQRAIYNFDHPDAIDFELACSHIRQLVSGKTIHQPIYDFKVHTRKHAAQKVAPTPLIIIEGLYALYPLELLSLYNYRIFLSTGSATAVLRRIQRDVEERGRDMEGAKHQILTTVLPMYEKYVKPTQRNAHFSINWEGEEIPGKATEGLVRMIRDYFR